MMMMKPKPGLHFPEPEQRDQSSEVGLQSWAPRLWMSGFSGQEFKGFRIFKVFQGLGFRKRTWYWVNGEENGNYHSILGG